jgi:hypothetical protein
MSVCYSCVGSQLQIQFVTFVLQAAVHLYATGFHPYEQKEFKWYLFYHKKYIWEAVTSAIYCHVFFGESSLISCILYCWIVRLLSHLIYK